MESFISDINLNLLGGNNLNTSNISIFLNKSGDNIPPLSFSKTPNRDLNFSGLSSINLDESEVQSKSKKRYKKKKRIRKIKLVQLPLPIFECAYCANEKIVFNYCIQKRLCEKYVKTQSDDSIKGIEKLSDKLSTLNNINTLRNFLQVFTNKPNKLKQEMEHKSNTQELLLRKRKRRVKKIK